LLKGTPANQSLDQTGAAFCLSGALRRCSGPGWSAGSFGGGRQKAADPLVVSKEMTRANSYFELLRHPNWQRKRLEIMQRHEFACEDCGARDKTLNVHHSYYEKDLSPWEYPDESLHCLCESCHEKAQALYNSLKRQLGKLPLSATESLLGYALGLEAQDSPMVRIERRGSTYEVLQGVGQCWGLSAEEVIAVVLNEGGIDGYKLRELAKAKKAAKRAKPL
jgi:hypothetical protein